MPVSDIGMYIQPIEHNRACRPEFTFFYDPADEAEKAIIRCTLQSGRHGASKGRGRIYKALR